ncbi:MAG: hypothetical protein N2235_18445 [Fischerella sp.]|nr:hypothetical protein [Fischerella sp.]
MSHFYQVPVLMEYIIERLIEENFQLSQQQANSSPIAHTYLETQLKNEIKYWVKISDRKSMRLISTIQSLQIPLNPP